MIRVLFFQHEGHLSGVSLSGHAGYAAAGEDIVCAAVSTAVQITANTLTEIFHIDADVSAEENVINIKLQENSPEEAEKLLMGLELEMKLLEEDYPKFIQIKHTEV